ncbi:hypothetical protein GXB85_04735 [Cellulomonas sp. APG4]|uniref:hypothetical protein n=1 Tax=Cellulomonas sp. APG4 TaxID=1538656 RepID=UPI00137A7085|nr:hypothetical protein [Cellulomonas sp. APG4]NCT90260.1 hypothetical protein [Cellulomonas sp. APG4]
MSALDDWREVAAGPKGIPPGGSGLPWVVARLISIDDDANRAIVSINGSQPVGLPFHPNAYEGITTVYVQLDPLRTGAGQVVTGPCYEVELPDEIAPVPPPPPTTVKVGPVTILPTWSGTWRSSRGAWDRWNAGRYGGRSDLYQGDAYGSGPLKGLATYGNQIVGLGAEAILSMTLSSVRSNGSGTPAFQGSPHGSRPAGSPASSGGIATGLVAVDLVASGIAEDLRTGAAKGICTVGSGYGAVRGTSHPTGMAITLTYTRAG